MPAHRMGRLWKFKINQVDPWIEAGGADGGLVRGGASSKKKTQGWRFEQEQNAIRDGSRLQAIVDINAWARNYEEIDVFNWRQIHGECLSSSELELELTCSSGIIRKAVEKKVIMPDHTVPIGNRKYYFFDRKRVEEVRQALNLPRVTAENVLEMFIFTWSLVIREM